ncbi:unnamed protein product, partial [Cyprideis torosa]
MKAIVQRVSRASVSVDGEIVSSIGQGICVFIGIARNDQASDLEYIIRKLLNVRVFENPTTTAKKWDLSVKDAGGEILCVSQFTLHSVLKGNKLEFRNAKSGDESKS